jgi:hypothetical protein
MLNIKAGPKNPAFIILGVFIMSFFKSELTEIELIQKEIDIKSRLNANPNYIVDEDNFIEVKIGGNNVDKPNNSEQLPSERNINVSDRGGN